MQSTKCIRSTRESEGAMKNGQFRESGNILSTRRRQKKTQHHIGHHHAQDDDRKKNIMCAGHLRAQDVDKLKKNKKHHNICWTSLFIIRKHYTQTASTVS